MGQFYRGNSQNAIGGPARVLITGFSYPAPQKLNDIIDVAGGTYNLATLATYGWQEIGLTDAPTTFQIETANTQWASQQFGMFRTSPTDWSGQVHTEAVEVTQVNKANLMMATRPADSATGEARTNFAARTSLPYYRVVVLMMDQNNHIHAAVFPKCQWDGAAIQSSDARGEMQKIPVTWRAYPDDAQIDAETGQALLRYDFDQF